MARSTEIADKPIAHWPTIEADYRAGIKSVRQIAAEHGITEGAVRKRAKAQEWFRDLSGQIQAKADALVRMEAVRTAGTQGRDRVPDKVVVEANGTVLYQVQLDIRNSVNRVSGVFDTLVSELEATGIGADLLKQLIEAVHPPGDGESEEEVERRLQRQRDLLARMLALHGRIDSGKKLVEMLEKIVRMKREAYGLDKAQPPDEGGFASKLTDAERAARVAALFAIAKKRGDANAA